MTPGNEAALSARKTTRWLDLIAFLLQHRFPVARERIFQAVGAYRADLDQGRTASVRRKFERDKDELRALGIEIETVPLVGGEGDEPQCGYQLKPRDLYLPYLELTEHAVTGKPYAGLRSVTLTRPEVALLDRATRRVAERTEVALSGATRSLRRKLAFDLPLSDEAAERVLAAAAPARVRETLATLQDALARRRAVRCRYFTINQNREDERVIEPYGIFLSWGRWYVVGQARDRGAIRVFRVERMRDAAILETDKPVDVPPAFSIRQWLGRAPWELAEREAEAVRVRFAFPDSRWVLHQRVGRPVDAERDDGGAIIEFDVRDRHPFVRWLLTFGTQAEVIEPEGVQLELADLRRRVTAIYAGGTKGGTT